MSCLYIIIVIPTAHPFTISCGFRKKRPLHSRIRWRRRTPIQLRFIALQISNYYPQGSKPIGSYMNLFVSLGGKPKERHPLSFVLQGSDYLNSWFDNGITTKIPLKDLPSEFVSFTYGDSVSTYKRKGTVEIFTKEN